MKRIVEHLHFAVIPLCLVLQAVGFSIFVAANIAIGLQLSRLWQPVMRLDPFYAACAGAPVCYVLHLCYQSQRYTGHRHVLVQWCSTTVGLVIIWMGTFAFLLPRPVAIVPGSHLYAYNDLDRTYVPIDQSSFDHWLGRRAAVRSDNTSIEADHRTELLAEHPQNVSLRQPPQGVAVYARRILPLPIAMTDPTSFFVLEVPFRLLLVLIFPVGLSLLLVLQLLRPAQMPHVGRALPAAVVLAATGLAFAILISGGEFWPSIDTALVALALAAPAIGIPALIISNVPSPTSFPPVRRHVILIVPTFAVLLLFPFTMLACHTLRHYRFRVPQTAAATAEPARQTTVTTPPAGLAARPAKSVAIRLHTDAESDSATSRRAQAEMPARPTR